MDVLRTCYSTTMTFSVGGTPVPVRWYRASPFAKEFPADHCFFSLDWEDDQGPDALGEQRPPRGTWDAGMRPAALLGQGHFKGTIETFQDGLSPGEDFGTDLSCALEPGDCVCGPGPFDAPPGNEDTFPVWHLTCGGLRWAEENAFPQPPLMFTVTLYQFAAGVGIDGSFLLTFDSVSKTWKGTTVFTCSSTLPFTANIEGVLRIGGTMDLTIDVLPSGCGLGGTMTGHGPFIFFDNVLFSPSYAWDNTLPDFDSPPVNYFTFDP